METTYVNLKILSQLKPFERVNTRRELFTIQNSNMRFLPNWFARWLDGSNRESDYGRIRDLYQTCEEFLREHPADAKMRRHIDDSIRGLRALKKTYEYDVTHQARIDTLIERMAPEPRVEESEAISDP